MELDRLYLHDARCLSEIISPTEPFVDVIITSPPYYNLKNYEAANQIGYGQTKEQYLADVETVLLKCHQVTKDTGSLWIVIDDYRDDGILQLLPWEISRRCSNIGWKLRDLIIWDKQHTIPWAAKGHMRKVFEFILFFTKTDEYKYDVDRVKVLDEVSRWWVDFPERFSPKGKTPTNIWHIPIRTQGTWPLPSQVDHHCPFPTTLVARIIELTTDPNDVVLDPFAGSGIALAQAAAMGRRYIGFEINKRYVRAFDKHVKRRVAEEWRQLQNWRQSQGTAQVDFEQTVMKLRALKFARQVTKPFLSRSKSSTKCKLEAVLCVASLPKEYSREIPLDVLIWLIVDKQPRKFQSALNKALKLALRPPLSQFGIRAGIKVTTRAALRSRVGLLNKEFYLYTAYWPRKYVARYPLNQWFKESRLSKLAAGAKIPLLSNVGVDVAYVLEH